MDWSYALLNENEQVLLDRLGVFAGGFTLDAAEAVAVDESENVDVLDRLGQLVDKSLVVVEEEADGSTRYRLLETIRQYALERLDASGDGDRVRRRHAEHYIEVAGAGEAAMGTFGEEEWFHTIDRELGNFRARSTGRSASTTLTSRSVSPSPSASSVHPVHDSRSLGGSHSSSTCPTLVSIRCAPTRRVGGAREVSISGSADLGGAGRAMDAAFEEAGIELRQLRMPHTRPRALSGDDDETIYHATAAVDLTLGTAIAGGPRHGAVCWLTLAALGRPEDAMQAPSRRAACGRVRDPLRARRSCTRVGAE